VAELARKHNDANVLVLPARFLSDEDGIAILQRWLDTDFEGGRHERRVAKIERDDDAPESADDASAGVSE
jgi:ribose 5-phosphate isomerase B